MTEGTQARPERVMVLEPDAERRQMLAQTLMQSGFRCFMADSVHDALPFYQDRQDSACMLTILNARLPWCESVELLSRAQENDWPVLFLTAKTAVNDRVRGLRLGAEDYMLKPFEPEELLARVENILRRARKERTRFVFDALTVDLPSRRVTKDGREVALTALEFDLLAMLVRRNNVALSREALLAGVWGYAYQGETRTVDVHIQRLRGKIGAEYIETVYKYGYRFCGKEVERR